MFGYIFSLCLISIIPHYSLPTIDCESVQINHFYDETGRLIFDQLMCQNRVETIDGDADVCIWWCILKNCRLEDTEKRKIWEANPLHKDISYPGEYIANYLNDSAKKTILINYNDELTKINYKGLVYETWTQHDPELASRAIYPKEKHIKPMPYHKLPPIKP